MNAGKSSAHADFLYLQLIEYYRILTDILAYLLSQSLQKVCKTYA
nr:MAG TPA: hypothetical protein [Caudoviricetes sp.]